MLSLAELDEALAHPYARPLALQVINDYGLPFLSFTPRPDQPQLLDQQASFVHESFPGVAVVLAGTGSGKSLCCAWKVANFIRTTPPPRSRTPFWIASQSLEMACGVCWGEKLSQFLPPSMIDSITWHNQARGHPAAVVLKNGWVVECKSYDMSRERLQGASIGGFWCDEAAPHSIIVELWGRCRDYDFPCKLYSLTPLSPTPELRQIYETRDKHPDWRFYRMNSECNTTLAQGWRERFIASEIPELRQTRLTGEFSALTGQCFQRNWFRFYDDEEDGYRLDQQRIKAKDCLRITTVDLAISTKDTADYTVAQTWDITGQQNMILVDEWRVKAEGPAIISGLKRVYERLQPSMFAVEAVAYQKLMAQLLRQSGLPVKEIDPGGKDKVARSARFQVKADAGQIWLPRLPWVDDWLAEVCSFPHGTYDDRVDCGAYACQIASKQPLRQTDQPQPEPEAEKRKREHAFFWGGLD